MTDDGIGMVIIQRRSDGTSHIAQADPRVLVDVGLIEEARKGDLPCMDVTGDVVTLADDYGQRFIYRLDPKPRADTSFRGACYLMEWPD